LDRLIYSVGFIRFKLISTCGPEQEELDRPRRQVWTIPAALDFEYDTRAFRPLCKSKDLPIEAEAHKCLHIEDTDLNCKTYLRGERERKKVYDDDVFNAIDEFLDEKKALGRFREEFKKRPAERREILRQHPEYKDYFKRKKL